MARMLAPDSDGVFTSQQPIHERAGQVISTRRSFAESGFPRLLFMHRLMINAVFGGAAGSGGDVFGGAGERVGGVGLKSPCATKNGCNILPR